MSVFENCFEIEALYGDSTLILTLLFFASFAVCARAFARRTDDRAAVSFVVVVSRISRFPSPS